MRRACRSRRTRWRRVLRPTPCCSGPWAAPSGTTPERLADVDLLIVRELTGGLYFGRPQGIYDDAGGRRAVDTMAYSEAEIERVLKVGFASARERRRRLTSVDKANVLATSRLWRQVATRLGADYPDVELEHLLVDSAAMRLVTAPGSFDVIVTENTFGDILSDEASVLCGSLGRGGSGGGAGEEETTKVGRPRGVARPHPRPRPLLPLASVGHPPGHRPR